MGLLKSLSLRAIHYGRTQPARHVNQTLLAPFVTSIESKLAADHGTGAVRVQQY